jgi:hypothetical protein
MQLLIRLIPVTAILYFGCGGDKTSGEACDMGMGEITEAVCAAAAEAAGCESHQVSQKSEALCTGKPKVTRSCCVYNNCGSHPTFPTPAFPPCTP